MGEPEDEFAKAEALLQRLEQEPVTGPGIIEQAVEAKSIAAKTFRVNSYYEAPVELFANRDLYTNKNLTNFPAQTNGDIYPYIVGRGRVRGSEFAVDGKIYYKVIDKSKDQSEYMIQIATAGFVGRNSVEKSGIGYLNAAGVIDDLGILYIVRCNAEVFKRTIPVNSAKEWPSSGFKNAGFLDCRVNILHRIQEINTAYADACVKHVAKEQAKQKAKADALWAQKNAKAFIKSQKLEIKKIAEEIFPGNAYFIGDDAGENMRMNDVFVRDYGDLTSKKISNCLLIHFPSFDIINRDMRTHNIKDLWVLIPFDTKTVKAPNTDVLVRALCMQSNLWGCRGTQTSAESMSGYKHSHLSSSVSGDKKFSSFCLGGSSSINVSVAELSNYFTVDRFELFLYELSAYVKYESIEGGPYIRMENIGKKSNNIYTSNVDYKREYDNFILDIISNNTGLENYHEGKFVLPVEYDLLKKQYVLNENNEAFLQFLGNSTSKPQVKDVDGTLVQYSEIKAQYTAEQKLERTHRMFRLPDGDEYFAIVDPTDNIEEESEVTLYPSADLTRYIKNKVEEELDIFYTLKESYEFS